MPNLLYSYRIFCKTYNYIFIVLRFLALAFFVFFCVTYSDAKKTKIKEFSMKRFSISLLLLCCSLFLQPVQAQKKRTTPTPAPVAIAPAPMAAPVVVAQAPAAPTMSSTGKLAPPPAEQPLL
jgi:hypothetical protein